MKGGRVSNMSFYKICPDCGANLDPGERCDCISEKEKQKELKKIKKKEINRMIAVEDNGQLKFAV